MSQTSGSVKVPAEKIVQSICRATRKRYSTEVLEPPADLLAGWRPRPELSRRRADRRDHDHRVDDAAIVLHLPYLAALACTQPLVIDALVDVPEDREADGGSGDRIAASA
jgi:hypothetical protein